MASQLNPYLNFNGTTRQALEFYHSVLGGDLALTTFAEFGAADGPDADRIMHGMLVTDAGYTIMAADVTSEMEYHPMAGFALSLSGDDGDALRGYWESFRPAGPPRCRCKSRPGATSSACAWTNSARPGWLTSPSRRRSDGADHRPGAAAPPDGAPSRLTTLCGQP